MFCLTYSSSGSCPWFSYSTQTREGKAKQGQLDLPPSLLRPAVEWPRCEKVGAYTPSQESPSLLENVCERRGREELEAELELERREERRRVELDLLFPRSPPPSFPSSTQNPRDEDGSRTERCILTMFPIYNSLSESWFLRWGLASLSLKGRGGGIAVWGFSTRSVCSSFPSTRA